jgi:hypothetical protein
MSPDPDPDPPAAGGLPAARLLAAVLALIAGIVALVIVIELARSALS